MGDVTHLLERWQLGATAWICPTCDRRFAKANQWHSCKPQDVDVHFDGKDPKLPVGFLARTPVESPKIVRRFRLGPGRVGHSVIVESRKDIDAQLLRWLAAAQRLQS